MRFGLRQAFVDHTEQCGWPEGLAQAACRAELSAILRKSGLEVSRLENAYPEIAISGTVGA